jgi:hypothetical protein
LTPRRNRPGSVLTVDHAPVHLEIGIDHAVAAESADCGPADGTAVDGGESANGANCFVNVTNQEAGSPVVDQLRHGTAMRSHDWSPAGHGFDDAKAKGLFEVDEMQKGLRSAEEGSSFISAHRAEVPHAPVIETR